MDLEYREARSSMGLEARVEELEERVQKLDENVWLNYWGICVAGILIAYIFYRLHS